MYPKINFSKVAQISATMVDDGFIATITYKSGQRRGVTFGNDEPGLDALFADAQNAGVTVIPLSHEPQPSENTVFSLNDHPYGDCVEQIGQLCFSCLVEHDEFGNRLPDITSPNVLVQMLLLTPEQAKALGGADRLNFWRNGCLSVQVQHGSMATKLKCPTAVVTDAQLIELFATWGWTQVNNKLYFQAKPNSVVRL